jgi:hypothetical protein
MRVKKTVMHRNTLSFLSCDVRQVSPVEREGEGEVAQTHHTDKNTRNDRKL